MIPVFAGTSYYVALLGPKDAHHDAAVDWGQRLLGRMVVTKYIIAELGSALSAEKDRHLFAPFVDDLMNDPGIRFVPASAFLFVKG